MPTISYVELEGIPVSQKDLAIILVKKAPKEQRRDFVDQKNRLVDCEDITPKGVENFRYHLSTNIGENGKFSGIIFTRPTDTKKAANIEIKKWNEEPVCVDVRSVEMPIDENHTMVLIEHGENGNKRIVGAVYFWSEDPGNKSGSVIIQNDN
jgi:hypothetical protein